MLDAGHGGSDPGAVYEGRQEKDDNLRLVLAVGEILQNHGINVEYTRTTDIYQSPYEKAMEANKAGVDFFISIHRNSFPTDNTVSGVESLIYDMSGIKYEMAQNINEQLEAVGFVNLGVKERPNLVVLRRTQMPAVLVEAGFINSNTDNELFDDNFSDIAEAIAAGILDTLEMEGVVASAMENVESVPEMSRQRTMEENTGEVRDIANRPGRTDTDEECETEDHLEKMQYHVQVGAFRMEMYAHRLLEELLEQDYPACISHSGGFYRVQVGNFDQLDDAVAMEHRLKRAGYPTPF